MTVYVTIYMPLLNKDTFVWSLVEAEQVTDECFTVLGPTPKGEDWAFPPGTVVRCENRILSNDKVGLVAVEGVWRHLQTTFLEYLERRAATEPKVRELLEQTDRDALNITCGSANMNAELQAKGATIEHIIEVGLYFTTYARAMGKGGWPRRLKVQRVT